LVDKRESEVEKNINTDLCKAYQDEEIEYYIYIENFCVPSLSLIYSLSPLQQPVPQQSTVAAYHTTTGLAISHEFWTVFELELVMRNTSSMKVFWVCLVIL
jgi:hypothetical protein